MTLRHEDTAADRLQRVLYTACGIGALVFGGLLVTGPSGIIAQRDELALWFWWTTVVIVIAVPASLVVLARVAPLRVSRTLARVAVVGFVAVQALWVPAMSSSMLAPGTTPWIQGITALPSTLAGATLRSRWVWAFPLLQGVAVTTVQLLSSDRSTVDAVLDGVGAVFYCSVLTGIARAVIAAGVAQDRAAARARKAAMRAAASTTAERERTRINAIVHDDIMSVLLAASRPGSGDITPQAQRALGAVRAIADPMDGDDSPLSCAHASAALRAVVQGTQGAQYTLELIDDGSLPSQTVAAVTEATAEALTNARRHAGSQATVTVSARIGGDAVSVVVVDDGQGFDPGAVSPTRLGIRASIAGRMASLPGGSSTVTSAPGQGTSVAISWRRP